MILISKSRWLLAVLLACSAVWAQDYRAKVQGTVTDQTNAAVAQATVTLLNTQTGVPANKTTDESGRYLFDYVTPGQYEVRVEAPGFGRWKKTDITVLTRGDVTVDAQLGLNAVDESVSVTASVGSVEFNTSTLSTTVAAEQLRELPVLARNPFTLVLLDPAVVNEYSNDRNPFYMWSTNGVDIGGPSAGKNDVELDGVPLGVYARGSYAPPMDGVQEVAVQQNPVDAEAGFTAGGVMSVSMKSGSNDYHGTAYYFGRNPALNALQNRVSRSENTVRNHIWGFTLGNPIVKNKLFTFNLYEGWRTRGPSDKVETMPTDLERTGDFSQSRNVDGGLRTIYDPWSSSIDPQTGLTVRTPFAGNVIPKSRIDPTAAIGINDLWKPNNAGDDITGVNNFRTSYSWFNKYWNYSNRTDYNINDRLRMYARFSKYQTRLDNDNWGGTIAVPSDNGGLMDALNAAADVLYVFSPKTVIDVRYGVTYTEDEYASDWAKVGESEWAKLWPNSSWYKPVLNALGTAVYYPSFAFSGMGSASAGIGAWWSGRERQHNEQVSLTHDMGIHHIKIGQQLRYSYNDGGSPAPGGFNFNAADTAYTFQSPDISRSGDPYASFLLGVVNYGNTNINTRYHDNIRQWGFYIHDDVRLTNRVTLNLGLRYEYETAPYDDNNIFVRYLDLNNPIPEMQSTPPQIPAEVRSVANIAYRYNGALVYETGHQGIYNAPKLNLMPRAGVAIRIDDRSAIRVGYARYAVPEVSSHPEGWSYSMYGYSQGTGMLGSAAGVPQAVLSDPYPSTNPVRLPVGDGYGRYTNLGDSVSWYNQDLKTAMNDRFNFSIQRQLPYRFLVDATYFMNLGHNIVSNSMWGGDFTRNLNMVDPNYKYTLKAQYDTQVTNPFYGYGTPETFPGSLRYRPTVSLGELLKVYPQYGDLNQSAQPGFSDHYQAIQIKVDRPLANGLMLKFGFSRNWESTQNWFNDIAQYANQKTWIDSAMPTTRLTLAATYELPFGKGRTYANRLNPVIDAIIGGWTTSHLLTWNSGTALWFDAMPVLSDPSKNVPNGYYFNPNAFGYQEAYTPRTNPWYFYNIRGAAKWQLDSTLSKTFKINERFSFEFRTDAYNLTNSFIPNDPDTGRYSPNFGLSTNQYNQGRQLQYTGRLHF